MMYSAPIQKSFLLLDLTRNSYFYLILTLTKYTSTFYFLLPIVAACDCDDEYELNLPLVGLCIIATFPIATVPKLLVPTPAFEKLSSGDCPLIGVLAIEDLTAALPDILKMHGNISVLLFI